MRSHIERGFYGAHVVARDRPAPLAGSIANARRGGKNDRACTDDVVQRKRISGFHFNIRTA
jgi:hypothetical protein